MDRIVMTRAHAVRPNPADLNLCAFCGETSPLKRRATAWSVVECVRGMNIECYLTCGDISIFAKQSMTDSHCARSFHTSI